MKLANNNKPLTPLEIFKYTIPLPLRVRSKQLDTHIRKEIAEASVYSSLIMATVSIFVGLALYFLVINENEKYGDIWIGFASFTYIVIIFAHLFVKKQKKLNRLTVYTAYLAFFVPTTFSAFIWGTMPLLVDNQEGYIAMLCYVASFLIIYGSSSWIIGLTWLNLYYACLAVLPLFSYAFWDSEYQLSIIILALLFSFGTWITAHVFASGVIIGADQKFKLKKQSTLIENLLNEFQVNSSDWVWETDSDHILTFMSIEFENSQDFKKKTIHMVDFTNLFIQTDPNTNSLRTYLNDQTVFDQLVVKFNPKTSMGSKKTWELRGRPVFDESGEFIGYRGFGRDISNIQELNDLNNSKEKFDIMSKFIAKIAHDFNNSLMVIQSSIEILKMTEEDKISSDGKDVIHTIHDAVNSASRMNKELLSFARQEVLSPTSVDLHNILQDLIKSFKMRAPDVKFNLKMQSPIYIYVDRYALIRTLENVFVNSTEAMDHVGKIEMSATSVDLGAGNQIILRLEDSGTGFSEAALKSATEPFFTTKKRIGGSGLGLATAAGFVQQSGGEMRWGNSINGAFIEINFKSVVVNFQTKFVDKYPVSDLTCVNILIVDDDKEILRSLSNQFKRLFKSVTFANSIDEAISIVNSHACKFDVMLCDFQFKDDERHGVDLAEIVSNKVRHIIFMTGYSLLFDELSNYDVLPKPFGLQEFKETYHALLSRDSQGFRRQRHLVAYK